MKRLDNKVAIVTGASKGIGAGIAKAFGAEGAAVIVNYARDVLGLADAAQRRTRDYLLLRLRSHDARRVRTLRFGSTGIESVNADFSGAELF